MNLRAKLHDTEDGFTVKEGLIVLAITAIVSTLFMVAISTGTAFAHNQGGLTTGANASTQPAGHLLEGSVSGSPDDLNGKTYHCSVGFSQGASVTIACQGTWGAGASISGPGSTVFACTSGGGSWGWGAATAPSAGKWTKTVASWPCANGSATITGVSFSTEAVLIVLASGTPQYPADYFFGGSVGYIPPLSGTVPTLACSRILSQNNGSNVATVNATNTGGTSGYTATYSWAWGDSTTAGTAINMQHIYPALTSMPSGGWTATLTASYTAPTGYEYSPGVTTATRTCSLRIDYLNPSSTTVGTDIDSQDDADCPTGFGWINPLAIVKIAKCLFIPSSSSMSAFSHSFDGATSKAPFSYVAEVMAFIPDRFAEIQDGIAEGAGTCRSFLSTFDSSGNMTSGSATLPGTSTSPNVADPGGGATFSVNCGHTQPWWISLIRGFTTAIALLALGFGVYRSIVWAISS